MTQPTENTTDKNDTSIGVADDARYVSPTAELQGCEKAARLSDCGRYRYWLGRPRVSCSNCGNPSTTDGRVWWHTHNGSVYCDLQRRRGLLWHAQVSDD